MTKSVFAFFLANETGSFGTQHSANIKPITDSIQESTSKSEVSQKNEKSAASNGSVGSDDSDFISTLSVPSPANSQASAVKIQSSAHASETGKNKKKLG